MIRPIYRSDPYKAYISTLPCVVCEISPCDPHHTTVGGMRIKGTDYHCIPLCRYHHDEHDHMGKQSFYEHYGIDRWEEVANNLEGWIVRMMEWKEETS